MNEARAAILRRIQTAQTQAPSRGGAIPRGYRTGLPTGVDVVGRFVERVADYRATVHRSDSAALAQTIARVLRVHDVRTVVTPDGLARSWLGAIPGNIRVIGDDPPLSHADLDRVDAVVTGCAVAIAETGTIVLDDGPDQGRRVLSLLPDRHVCIVSANLIVGDVPEAIPRLDPRRPMTWISGPSATSDIELQRVEGVHGPRHLDVIVVRSQERHHRAGDE